MKRPLPCAHCGKSVTRQEDLVTRVVNLNFAYFCSEHCANKLKLPGLAPTPVPPAVAPVFVQPVREAPAEHALPAAEPVVARAENPATTALWDDDVEQAERAPVSERARTLVAVGVVFLGLFARSASWPQWASCGVLCAFLLFVSPLCRARMRLGTALESPEVLGAYTLALGLWAYVAAVFSGAWWVCALALAAFAWVAFGLRAVPHLPSWLGLFARGEWQYSRPHEN